MKNPYQTVSSKIAYKTPYVTMREDKIIQPDGQPGIYSVIDDVNGAFVVAVNDRNEVYLTRQFRYPTQTWGLEVPAGAIDEGETPLQAAKRELQEETGLTAAQWTTLGMYHPFNGHSSARSHLYLAQAITEDPDFTPPVDEAISGVIKIPLAEISALVTSGQIIDGQSAFALLLALQKLSV